MRRKKIPVIGITTYGRDAEGQFYLPGEYVDSVRRAGGLPVLLTPGETNITQALQIVDGVILAGGGDFGPTIYGGESHPAITRVDAERDAFEVLFADRLLHEVKPVLGICRGFQLLNIVTGGNLLAHLPDKYGEKVCHRADNGGTVVHEVSLLKESRLGDILGEGRIPVQSKHHQALGRISSGWRVTAHADDGVIEAMEHETHPWMIAVHWHPELAPEDQLQQKLFREFIAASM